MHEKPCKASRFNSFLFSLWGSCFSFGWFQVTWPWPLIMWSHWDLSTVIWPQGLVRPITLPCFIMCESMIQSFHEKYRAHAPPPTQHAPAPRTLSWCFSSFITHLFIEYLLCDWLSWTHLFNKGLLNFCHEDEGVENLPPVCSVVPLIHSNCGEFEQPHLD